MAFKRTFDDRWNTSGVEAHMPWDTTADEDLIRQLYSLVLHDPAS